MINDQKHLLGQLRTLLSENNKNLRLRNGIWTVTDRKSVWVEAGKYIFDEHLDKIKDIAVSALREPNPKFNMPPEKRMFCQEKPKYSTALRNGVAETLAQIGACPDALVHATQGKPQLIARLAVREVLEEAEWITWASIDSLLPMLAEASPEEFMEQIETALRKEHPPFLDLYEQERDAFLGGTLICGLLWALETLAWSPDYLHRVIVILGKLASIDPGGRWSNRPSNSIIEILVPWLPHTCAPVEARVSSVRALLKNVPEVGWSILLSLLPNGHRTTSCTHQPKWRNFADGWEERVTVKDLWAQYTVYAETAVDVATSDFDKLIQVLNKISDLPLSTWDKLEAHLTEQENTFSEEQKKCVWEALFSVILKHRKFSDAKWSLPKSGVDRLEAIAEKFEPLSSFLHAQPLFSTRDFELFDGEGSYEEKSDRLLKKRMDAIRSIYDEGGQDLLIKFRETISDHFNFGLALGLSDVPVSDGEIIVSGWEKGDDGAANFAAGFISARFKQNGWSWVDGLQMENWGKTSIGKTLSRLPFSHETWNRADRLMGDEQSIYWQTARANHWDAGDHLAEGIEKLIKYDCPAEAINCMALLKPPLDKELMGLAVNALRKMMVTKNKSQRFDVYDTVQVIGFLQESDSVDPDTLFEIEWGYLQILNSHNNSSPKQLETRLADDPQFFCEVLRLVYRSSKESDGDMPTLSDTKKQMAENAWHLLHEWRRVPGTTTEGAIDEDKLKAWIEEVEDSCKESGHYEVAQICTGHVFRYASQDPSGLWIHKAVAEVLDRDSATSMRSGYRCEWFNSREVFSYTHGTEERKLAEQFKEKAEAAEAEGYVNLATTMRDLAHSYEQDAEREEKNDPLDRL